MYMTELIYSNRRGKWLNDLTFCPGVPGAPGGQIHGSGVGSISADPLAH